LTALTDLTGSEPKAIEVAAKIFRLKGIILPITTKNVQLKALYVDGKEIIGEHEIDEPKHIGGIKIVKLTTKPRVNIYQPSRTAILQADLIILGPGDLYTSILPNLTVKGIKKTFSKTKAKIIYIVNLMTRYSQTHGYTALDHVNAIEKYLGKKVDFVFMNKSKIPLKIINVYQKEKGYPVRDDLAKETHFKVIRKNFISPTLIQKSKGDILQGSFLRHDPKKLAKSITALLK